MKKLFLTAILALSLQSIAFAVETNDVDCDAFAESTERVSKDIKSNSENEKDDSAVKSN